MSKIIVRASVDVDGKEVHLACQVEDIKDVNSWVEEAFKVMLQKYKENEDES